MRIVDVLLDSIPEIFRVMNTLEPNYNELLNLAIYFDMDNKPKKRYSKRVFQQIRCNQTKICPYCYPIYKKSNIYCHLDNSILNPVLYGCNDENFTCNCAIYYNFQFTIHEILL